MQVNVALVCGEADLLARIYKGAKTYVCDRATSAPSCVSDHVGHCNLGRRSQ